MGREDDTSVLVNLAHFGESAYYYLARCAVGVDYLYGAEFVELKACTMACLDGSVGSSI